VKQPTILIAYGDEGLRQLLRQQFQQQGFQVIESPDNERRPRTLHKDGPDLVIVLSSHNNRSTPLELAHQLGRFDSRLPFLLIAKESSEELAIAALKAGYSDYFKVPFSFHELAACVKRCLADSVPRPADDSSATDLGLVGSQEIIGDSPRMREIKRYIQQVAMMDSNVLITGESGTGKELAAELIHRNSHRRRGPFICINCAAIPDNLLESELFGYERGAFTGASSSREGRLRLAEGGTAFFDEIGDMSAYAQAKILRTIENKEVHRLGAKDNMPVNVRVIAATNQDLEQSVSQKTFRKDLYFRLNVGRIQMPALRERKEDIPVILNHYVRLFNCRFKRDIQGMTREALQLLLRHDWPGNVREAKNLLEATYISLQSRRIAYMDLPEHFRMRFEDTDGRDRHERNRLLEALFSTSWNKSQAAQKLHWSRMTLYRKMSKYHILRAGDAEEALSSGEM
jgi:DNA-binding NtrC family response regulator